MKRLLLLLAILTTLIGNAQFQSNGPYGGNINCLAISGANIFAGTLGDGIFLSPDNGATWAAINNGLPVSIDITSIVIDSPRIFISTGYDIGGDTYPYNDEVGGSVYLSTDTGTTWMAVNHGLPAMANVKCLAMNGSTLFASLLEGYNSAAGLYTSTDNGNSWLPTGTGISSVITCFAFSGSTIYAGSEDGVYTSTNHQIWTPVDDLFSYSISSIVVNGSDILVGAGETVFLSTVGDNTWNRMDNGLPPVIQINSLASNGSAVYAGTDTGIFVTTDNGNSWTPDGLSKGNVQALTISGTNIYAGTADVYSVTDGIYSVPGDGVFSSVVGSSNWTLLNANINNTYVTSLATNDTGIYAGTYGRGVFLSTDNGANWNLLGLQNMNIEAVATYGTNVYVASRDSGFYFSDNKGLSWIKNHAALGYLTSMAVNDTGIFICNGNTIGLSTNNGISWVAPTLPKESTPVLAMAVKGRYLYIDTYYKGVYLSADYGNSWMPTDSGAVYREVNNIFITDTAVLMADEGEGIYVSYDTGRHWQLGALDDYITSFAVHGSNIYAGGYYNGLYVSTDQGITWNAANANIASTYVYALAVNDSTLFTGTWGAGVWQQAVVAITGVQALAANTTNGFNLYPNPATISFIVETTNTGAQQLRVFDLTGQLLLSQTIENSKTTIDASSLAAGVYLVSLKSGEGVSTEKLVVAR